MQPQLATFTDTATMLQEHKPTHEQTVVVMAPMVFMNENSWPNEQVDRAWQHDACVIKYNFQLAAAGKTSRCRLAAQLAVSVQRGRAQSGPASGLSLRKHR